jgi:hypothetical protein
MITNQPTLKGFTMNTHDLIARPHSNGNSRTDFIEAYKALNAAYDSLTIALRTVGANVTHLRNYQHLNARAADDSKIADTRFVNDQAVQARAAINTLISVLGDALVNEPI